LRRVFSTAFKDFDAARLAFAQFLGCLFDEVVVTLGTGLVSQILRRGVIDWKRRLQLENIIVICCMTRSCLNLTTAKYVDVSARVPMKLITPPKYFGSHRKQELAR